MSAKRLTRAEVDKIDREANRVVMGDQGMWLDRYQINRLIAQVRAQDDTLREIEKANLDLCECCGYRHDRMDDTLMEKVRAARME